MTAELAARLASRLRWASDRIAAVAGVCLTMAYLLDEWSGRK
jgi:hypothetical protein